MRRNNRHIDDRKSSFSGFLSNFHRKSVRYVMTAMLSGLWLVTGSGALYAQQTSATLVGSITDSNGAVVQNATVKVVNMATGAAREATTDDSGGYSFAFLPAGDYEVTI